MSLKGVKYCGALVIVLVAIYAATLAGRLGLMGSQDVYHHEATCRTINKKLVGGYDMIQYEDKVIVSQYNWIDLAGIKGPGKAAGGLYLVELGKNATTYTKLELEDFPADINFHPAGMDRKGDKLYVVNHALNKGGERIEVFQLSNGTQEEVTPTPVKDTDSNSTKPKVDETEEEEEEEQISVKWIKGHKLGDAYNGVFNDILVLDANNYYLSQWRNAIVKPENASAETASRLSSVTQSMSTVAGLQSSVLHHYQNIAKEKKWKMKKTAIKGGILKGMARDGNTMWLSDSLWSLKKVDITKPEAPKVTKEYKTDVWLENLSYDSKNKKIYAAYVSKPIQLFSWMKKSIAEGKVLKDTEVASGVLEIEKNGEMDELLRTDKLTVSSVIRVGKELLMGSCCDHGMLRCKYDNDPKE